MDSDAALQTIQINSKSPRNDSSFDCFADDDWKMFSFANADDEIAKESRDVLLLKEERRDSARFIHFQVEEGPIRVAHPTLALDVQPTHSYPKLEDIFPALISGNIFVTTFGFHLIQNMTLAYACNWCRILMAHICVMFSFACALTFFITTLIVCESPPTDTSESDIAYLWAILVACCYIAAPDIFKEVSFAILYALNDFGIRVIISYFPKSDAMPFPPFCHFVYFILYIHFSMAQSLIIAIIGMAQKVITSILRTFCNEVFVEAVLSQFVVTLHAFDPRTTCDEWKSKDGLSRGISSETSLFSGAWAKF